MNDKVMTKPSEVVRDFFQELVAGLPTGNMGAVDRHTSPDVEMTCLLDDHQPGIGGRVLR
jgi:hypothetical protein